MAAPHAVARNIRVNRRLSINGVHVNSELREPLAGQRAGDSGKQVAAPVTLVLLHGFTGSAAGWGTYLDTFASWGWRVIAIDLLGHGQSDAPDDPQRYSIEHCRQDMLAVLEELGVSEGEAILLGYSMGGRIALYTALAGFFRALILESASAGLVTAEERAERRASDEALAASIERDGVAAFVARWEQLPLFASQRALPAEKRAALREQRLHNRAAGLANSLRGAGTGMQPALHDELSTLTMPVLLIAGELDEKYSAIAQRMAHMLPHAELRIVSGAGHTVHLEQDEVFASLMREFVQTEI